MLTPFEVMFEAIVVKLPSPLMFMPPTVLIDQPDSVELVKVGWPVVGVTAEEGSAYDAFSDGAVKEIPGATLIALGRPAYREKPLPPPMPNTAALATWIESPTGGVRLAVVPTIMKRSALGQVRFGLEHELVNCRDVSVSEKMLVGCHEAIEASRSHSHAPFA